MALRVYANTAGTGSGTWSALISAGLSVPLGNTSYFTLKRVQIIEQKRPNNDGPGWTKNRTTTTPDQYRPIPFKALVAGASLIYELAMRRRDRL